MKKWYTYIIMLAALLFASCNVMEDPLHSDGECETEPVNVRLILSMMGERGLSRALTDTPGTTGSGTVDGVHTDADRLGNEYYINPYDVEVLVFTCDATPEESIFVERASMVRASETNDYYQYQLDGTLTKIQEGTPYRMVVLANMNGSCYTTDAIALEEGRTTMTDYLHSLAYTGYTANFTNSLLTSDTERIPMWGTTAAYLNDGAQINMDLLRAMAKVKVKMAKSLGNLSAVTLEYANPGGYVTPLIANVNVDETTATNANGVSAINNDAEKKTITGGNTQRVRTPRIPKGLTPINGLAAEPTLSFSDVSSTDNYEYVIYIPEYKNLGSEATPARMKLAIGDKSYKLEFKDYSEDNTGFFDIVRNYFYDYTITGVNDNSGMELTLSVKDWTDVTETFNYESELSYNDGGWTNNFGREGNTIVLKSSSEANASTVTAEYNFQINTPQTIEWMAVLEDPSMKFEFDMDKTSGKGTAEGENAIQRTVKGELLVTGSNLTLGVKAVDPSEKGQYDAKLHVYVTYSGKTIELDLVDGQESTLQHFTIRHSKL